MHPLVPRILIAWVLGSLVLLQGCAPLPPLSDRPASTRVEPVTQSPLGRSILPMTQEHPNLSGVVSLMRGGDAFAARVRLADAAQRSLDVQYYIWHRDLSGTLLIDALRRAAERGVRVRLLLDDNNTSGLDAPIAAMTKLPNVEVRLFNPFVARSWRPLGFLFDFDRLNRRMHNKSFTADNLATVIGGRNVGDEYFDAAADLLFVDLDVLAIGPVVDDVSRDFDRYWASGSSYPAQGIVPPIAASVSVALADAADDVEESDKAIAYRQALDQSPFVRDLLAHRLTFEWAPVTLVSDDPAKGLGRATVEQELWSRLKAAMPLPQRTLKLVSPYFVPGEKGTAELTEMARRGVKVYILTNSLEATDVVAVHAGYAKHRKALLEAGVVLYEVKRTSSAPPSRQSFAGSSGSSGSSLHAKTFSVDDTHLFIGSFNFDPRSERLNTEMGFVIESPSMARSIAEAFVRELPSRAYQVRLASDGALEWIERRNGVEIVRRDEPGATLWKRIGISVLSWLPIEGLL
ncbi:MAG: phospholipase D family protein [Caldimonas sp.]